MRPASAENHERGAPPYPRPDGPCIRVLVVDDNRLQREAIAELLRERVWVVEARVAASGAEALLAGVAFASTVTLLSMTMDDSLGTLSLLSDASARVVALGVRETEDELVACAESGAAGYLLRGDSLDSLCDVIQAVARGESIGSPKTVAVLLRRVATLAAERRARHGLGQLTTREAEILDLIEQGMANCDIAKALHIEVRTVKNHVHSILHKLGVSRRGQAAARVRAARPFVAEI
jgi:DNA-binding NarL/FixJ family response regulator